MRKYDLSAAEWDDIAHCREAVATLQKLMSTQLSWVLLLLPQSLKVAPTLQAACDLLKRAITADRAAAFRLLGHPPVAVWLGRTLRNPHWTVARYGDNIAAAAAILSGVEFTGQVLARKGKVVLPSLGVADLGLTEEWSLVPIGHMSDKVILSDLVLTDVGVDGPRWRASRRLSAGGVLLDDLEPYRGLPREVLVRLSDEDFARWRDMLAAAWELLRQNHPAMAAQLDLALTLLVPALPGGGSTPYSGTPRDGFGCIGLAPRPTAAEVAETLVHEFAHSKFSAIIRISALFDPADETLFASPWREDPRPLSGVLHGIYSFLQVAIFWHTQREFGDEAAQFHLGTAREQLETAFTAIRNTSGLTEDGRKFVAGMADRLRSLR
ncbi:HEXXH motif domain-containing protein [Actinocrispum sp. NPDC049592]|uniref:HEXXH motif domain-containing protein n=1 Tax=Actinocrispum sp. NPDC049592 TaxID=3154835 RepID=UPI003417CE1C